MKCTLREQFDILRTGFDLLRIEFDVYRKGGRFEKFDDGKYVKWYCRTYQNGNREFVPEIKVSGLSDEEFSKCIPKGRKLELE